MSLDSTLIERIDKRFDKVDLDNANIVKKVDEIQVKVDRHGVYWDITKWALPPALIAILGYLGFTKAH